MARLTPSKVLKLLMGLLMLLAALMVATSINSQKVEASVSTSSNKLPNHQLPRSSDHISLGNEDDELFTFVQVLYLRFISFYLRLRH